MKRPIRFKRLKGFFTLVGAVFSILIVLTILLSLFTGDSGLALGDKVGIVKVEGVIMDSIEINRQIKEFSERDDIKACRYKDKFSRRLCGAEPGDLRRGQEAR